MDGAQVEQQAPPEKAPDPTPANTVGNEKATAGPASVDAGGPDLAQAGGTLLESPEGREAMAKVQGTGYTWDTPDAQVQKGNRAVVCTYVGLHGVEALERLAAEAKRTARRNPAGLLRRWLVADRVPEPTARERAAMARSEARRVVRPEALRQYVTDKVPDGVWGYRMLSPEEQAAAAERRRQEEEAERQQQQADRLERERQAAAQEAADLVGRAPALLARPARPRQAGAAEALAALRERTAVHLAAVQADPQPAAVQALRVDVRELEAAVRLYCPDCGSRLWEGTCRRCGMAPAEVADLERQTTEADAALGALQETVDVKVQRLTLRLGTDMPEEDWRKALAKARQYLAEAAAAGSPRIAVRPSGNLDTGRGPFVRALGRQAAAGALAGRLEVATLAAS